MPDDLQTRVLQIRFPHIVAMASGTIAGPWREWPLVREEAKAVFGLLAQLKEEADRLRWVVKGAHGALTDACTVVVPGVLDGDIAPAIRQLTRERDEAREDAKTLREGWDREEKLRRNRDAILTRERDESRREVEVLRSCNQGVSADVEHLEAEVKRSHDAILHLTAEVERLSRERDEAERLRAHEYALVDQVRARLAEAKAHIRALAEAGDKLDSWVLREEAKRDWAEAKRKARL